MDYNKARVLKLSNIRNRYINILSRMYRHFGNRKIFDSKPILSALEFELQMTKLPGLTNIIMQPIGKALGINS